MQTNDQTLSALRTQPRITVIGLGGGGCNTVNRLSSLQMPGIRLVAANTDALALNACAADERILLGKDLTRGLGSGGDPEVGQKAAEDSFRELIGAIEGTDAAEGTVAPAPPAGQDARNGFVEVLMEGCALGERQGVQVFRVAF